MPSSIHFTHSSLREKLIENLFVSEILREAWKRGRTDIEVLQPEVDYAGYDDVFDAKGVMRHVQLKASHRHAKASQQGIHTSLGNKPSGCVVWVLYEERSLELGPFRWFGASPRLPLPDISDCKVAKHTKANAQGVKTERPALRRVSKGHFREIDDIEGVFEVLFGGDS